MSELAMPFFNMLILGSFLGWAIVEYIKIPKTAQ